MLQYSVYIWLAVSVLALIIEFTTSEMVSIWFAGGGITSMLFAAFGLVTWYVTIPIFFVVSFALLLLFRKLVLEKFNCGFERTNAETVIGKEFRLLSAITFDKPGTIKVNDIVWNATLNDEKGEAPKGSLVRVVEIKGNKYIVEVIK